MAKSRSGGTRAYIRGKVGADVYSIGKTAKGQKQQVVRSLAETVANPQTESQMRGRMIMSTVMQAVSVLSPIIDHSFDNVNGRQPNISEFISRNYALIKADAAAHPSSDNMFGLNKYQEKGIKIGQYLISDGDVIVPDLPLVGGGTGGFTVSLSNAGDYATVGACLAKYGLAAGDYFTAVIITDAGNMAFVRVKIADEIDGTLEASKANLDAIFTFEGSGSVSTDTNSQNYKITVAYSDTYTDSTSAVIVSKKTAEGWMHNQARFGAPAADPEFTADVALPTYPTGGADFLNGGDIFG